MVEETNHLLKDISMETFLENVLNELVPYVLL